MNPFPAIVFETVRPFIKVWSHQEIPWYLPTRSLSITVSQQQQLAFGIPKVYLIPPSAYKPPLHYLLWAASSERLKKFEENPNPLANILVSDTIEPGPIPTFTASATSLLPNIWLLPQSRHMLPTITFQSPKLSFLLPLKRRNNTFGICQLGRIFTTANLPCIYQELSSIRQHRSELLEQRAIHANLLVLIFFWFSPYLGGFFFFWGSPPPPQFFFG